MSNTEILMNALDEKECSDQLHRWEQFRAEMERTQKKLAKLSSSYLELDAYEQAAQCALKADGIKFVLSRMPKSESN